MTTQHSDMGGLLPAYAAGSLDADATARVSRHVAGCQTCREELAEWRLVASAAQQAAAVPAPSRGLLNRVFDRLDSAGNRPSWWERWMRSSQPAPGHRWAGRPLGGLAAAAVLVGVLFLTPVGTLAQQLLEVFQPKQFVIVPVTQADLEALPSLAGYGEFAKTTQGEPRRVASAAEAAAATGITLKLPASIPDGVPQAPTSFQVVPSASATFVFDASKAAETAKRNGKDLPPMPANIDGSSVQLTTGNAVISIYGGSQTSEDPFSGMPQLLIGQALVPTATSTGASAKDLQQYLLSQPGISPELAGAIRAIGDPTSAWPIPVPAGELRTRSATVQGMPATVFSDDGGFISGVIWVAGGMIYGVGGPLLEADVLAVANSLQ